MMVEGIKYRLIGYQPVGIGYNIPREEIAECKNGYWNPYGCGKRIKKNETQITHRNPN